MRQIIIMFITIFTLLSCSSQKSVNKRVITVTIEPLRYFTEQIAGDKFTVNTMVPAGSNPEMYEPTARQMVDLSASDLYLKVGNIGFERTWMSKLKENAPHTVIVNSSEGITPAYSLNGITDPHTWMSCENAIAIAKNIYAALAKEDSKNKEFYRQNLNKLIHKIQQTDAEIKNILAKSKPNSFLIYHPSLTYFAREYGLMQIPIEEEGREPSAEQMQKTIKTVIGDSAKILFVQREFAARNTNIIEKTTGTKRENINPLGYEWCKEMIKIAQLLK